MTFFYNVFFGYILQLSIKFKISLITGFGILYLIFFSISNNYFISKIEIMNNQNVQNTNNIQTIVNNIKLISSNKILINKEKILFEIEKLNKSIEVSTLVKKKMSETMQFSKQFTVTLSIMAIFIFLIYSFLIINNIKSKLLSFQNSLLDFFSYINKEKKEIPLLDCNDKDEISFMAKIINQNISKTQINIQEEASFLKELKSMIALINKGHLDKRFINKVNSKDLEEFRINFNEMLDSLNKNIGSNTNDILDVLISFEKLDFRPSIKNDKGEISHAINKLKDLITYMLVENKTNGLSLNSSAVKLQQSVESLDESSNLAAQSIQKTSHIVEEMSVNIHLSNKDITSMSLYAKELNISSSKGHALANETQEAMIDINKEVSLILDSIKLIEDIAFQTNILSLNAAVEAATAGEAGKGFSIVAQEVRNLANRSQQAANDIKNIVQTARNKTNDGKIISDNMIEGYTNLNLNISKTIELINKVDISSLEQLKSIEQINSSVQVLTKQTNDNVRISNDAKIVSEHTLVISKKIINNANEKKFDGKDDNNKKAYS